MIIKSEEHEIDRAGKRLLREVLESLHWVVNDVQEDYGIDYNVQVFDGDSPTGAWFHAQLKSSGKSDYSADHTFISQPLSVDHATHYALEMRQPIALIHADITASKLYWYFPQLDRKLGDVLSSTAAQSITVRIPARQELPQTAPDLLVSLKKIHLALANRELTSASTRRFAESLNHFSDQEGLARAFQEKNDALKLRKIADLYKNQQFEEAKARAHVVLVDPDSSVEMKFWAQIQMRSVDYHEILHGGKPQNELAKAALKHAKALQSLTRLGPRYLKFYSLITRQAAELEILADENSSLFMALHQHLERGGDPMLVLGLYARRSALARLITVKYNRCVRLARYAADDGERWALGRALTDVVNAIGRYIVTLGAEGNRDAQADFVASALQISKLAAWIGAETEDVNGILMAITSALVTTHSRDTDAFRWVLQTAQDLNDVDAREDALRMIQRAGKRWAGEKVDGDYQGDTVWQAVQNMATGIGLDISDENSVLVRELKIAARDNSPDRVLINCEHLLVTPGAMGPTARRIQQLLSIDTAGSKVVHCTMHDYHVEGRDLDSAYAEFKRRYCDSCPNTRPRSSNWRYDNTARQLEAVQHNGFVKRFAGKAFGMRHTKED